jgi:GDP-L-fucose synthase
MPTNLYFPHDHYDLEKSHVLPALIRKAGEAKLCGDSELLVWGTGKPYCEFLYVDDVADACVFLMENRVDKGMYNVGVSEDVIIRELAKTVTDVVGFQGRVIFDTSKPDGTPRKLMDVSRMTILGWKPKTSFGNGIALTHHDYLAGLVL